MRWYLGQLADCCDPSDRVIHLRPRLNLTQAPQRGITAMKKSENFLDYLSRLGCKTFNILLGLSSVGTLLGICTMVLFAPVYWIGLFDVGPTSRFMTAFHWTCYVTIANIFVAWGIVVFKTR